MLELVDVDETVVVEPLDVELDEMEAVLDFELVLVDVDEETELVLELVEAPVLIVVSDVDELPEVAPCRAVSAKMTPPRMIIITTMIAIPICLVSLSVWLPRGSVILVRVFNANV